MASVNKVILLGNCGNDPEVRHTQAGEPIANVSLATSESWTDKSGQRQTKTEWHRVEIFGKAAQVVRDYVKKGKPLYVEGSIHQDEYTDKQGIKRTSTKIRVSGFGGRIVLLGGREEKAEDPGSVTQPFVATDEDVPFSILLPFFIATMGGLVA